MTAIDAAGASQICPSALASPSTAPESLNVTSHGRGCRQLGITSYRAPDQQVRDAGNDGLPAPARWLAASHFHATNTAGNERVAGQFREDITFNNETAFSCTTNIQTWSATGA
jgi:hypothetical protein